MTKVVFDTNIFVSTIVRPQGLPAKLLDMATEGRFELIVSTQIIDELTRGLFYPKIRNKYELINEMVEVFIGFLLKTCRHVGEVPELYVVPHDPKDNPVVSTALACEADFLVSGDKIHILPLGRIDRLKVVSVNTFAEILKVE